MKKNNMIHKKVCIVKYSFPKMIFEKFIFFRRSKKIVKFKVIMSNEMFLFVRY